MVHIQSDKCSWLEILAKTFIFPFSFVVYHKYFYFERKLCPASYCSMNLDSIICDLCVVVFCMISWIAMRANTCIQA